jgi:uncharacterized protein YndB with AHSA1/START domain
MTIMMTRHISTSIEAPFEAVYAFLATPSKFPLWAEGLGHSFEPIDQWTWRAVTPMGAMNVRFTPTNSFGIADHTVIPDGAEPMSNPMRVIANGSGSEVIFTLFRRAGVTDEEFAADANAIAKDFATLKRLLESR